MNTYSVTAPIGVITALAIAWALSGCAPHALVHRVQTPVQRALQNSVVDAAPAPRAPALTPAEYQPSMVGVLVAPKAPVAAPIARTAPHAMPVQAWSCQWTPLDSDATASVERCGPVTAVVAPSVAYLVLR